MTRSSNSAALSVLFTSLGLVVGAGASRGGALSHSGPDRHPPTVADTKRVLALVERSVVSVQAEGWSDAPRASLLFDEVFGERLRRLTIGAGPAPERRRTQAIGAGVMVDPRHLVTAYHTVQDRENIAIGSAKGIREIGTVESIDLASDLALIHLRSVSGVPACLSPDLQPPGQWIMTVARRSGGGAAVAVGRTLPPPGRGYLRAHVPVTYGDSGSALVNAAGCLIAVVTEAEIAEGSLAGSVVLGRPVSAVRSLLERRKCPAD